MTRLSFSIFISCLLFGAYFISCASESTEVITDEPLIGQWTHIERAFSIGGPLITEDVNDGVVYNIKSGGTFTLMSATSESGTWRVADDVLSFDFDGEVGDRIVDFKYEIDGDILTLSPAFVICVEGCFDRYKKG